MCTKYVKDLNFRLMASLLKYRLSCSCSLDFVDRTKNKNATLFTNNFETPASTFNVQGILRRIRIGVSIGRVWMKVASQSD